MVHSVRFLCVAAIICAALIGTIGAAPVREEENDIDFTVNELSRSLNSGPSEPSEPELPDAAPSSTTENVAAVIARIYNPIRDKPGTIRYAGGVHQFRIKTDENENEQLLREYNYHFVRVEQNLPHTTHRADRFLPPSKD